MRSARKLVSTTASPSSTVPTWAEDEGAAGGGDVSVGRAPARAREEEEEGAERGRGQVARRARAGQISRLVIL